MSIEVRKVEDGDIVSVGLITSDERLLSEECRLDWELPEPNREGAEDFV